MSMLSLFGAIGLSAVCGLTPFDTHRSGNIYDSFFVSTEVGNYSLIINLDGQNITTSSSYLVLYRFDIVGSMVSYVGKSSYSYSVNDVNNMYDSFTTLDSSYNRLYFLALTTSNYVYYKPYFVGHCFADVFGSSNDGYLYCRNIEMTNKVLTYINEPNLYSSDITRVDDLDFNYAFNDYFFLNYSYTAKFYDYSPTTLISSPNYFYGVSNTSNEPLNFRFSISPLLSITDMGNEFLDGYNSGLSQGYQDGLNNGYEGGYRDGYAQGTEDGYDEGLDDGWSEGRSDGYTDGYDDGFAIGRTDGITHANDYSFLSLFGAVADTPVLMIRSLFNFDFFGVNLLTVVLSLFTALILFYLLRKLF